MPTNSPVQQSDIDEGGESAVPTPERVTERGAFTLPERAWAVAKRRAAVIVPLADSDVVSSQAARVAGEELGCSERTVYALVLRYRRSGGLLDSLAPRPSSGGRGKARLPRAAERIIAAAIQDEYLTRQKKRIEAANFLYVPCSLRTTAVLWAACHGSVSPRIDLVSRTL